MRSNRGPRSIGLSQREHPQITAQAFNRRRVTATDIASEVRQPSLFEKNKKAGLRKQERERRDVAATRQAQAANPSR